MSEWNRHREVCPSGSDGDRNGFGNRGFGHDRRVRGLDIGRVITVKRTADERDQHNPGDRNQGTDTPSQHTALDGADTGGLGLLLQFQYPVGLLTFTLVCSHKSRRYRGPTQAGG